jgi:hypothetical protein
MPAFGPFLRSVLALFVTMICLAPAPAVADLVVSTVQYSHGNPLHFRTPAAAE